MSNEPVNSATNASNPEELIAEIIELIPKKLVRKHEDWRIIDRKAQRNHARQRYKEKDPDVPVARYPRFEYAYLRRVLLVLKNFISICQYHRTNQISATHKDSAYYITRNLFSPSEKALTKGKHLAACNQLIRDEILVRKTVPMSGKFLYEIPDMKKAKEYYKTNLNKIKDREHGIGLDQKFDSYYIVTGKILEKPDSVDFLQKKFKEPEQSKEKEEEIGMAINWAITSTGIQLSKEERRNWFYLIKATMMRLKDEIKNVFGYALKSFKIAAARHRAIHGSRPNVPEFETSEPIQESRTWEREQDKLMREKVDKYNQSTEEEKLEIRKSTLSTLASLIGIASVREIEANESIA